MTQKGEAIAYGAATIVNAIATNIKNQIGESENIGNNVLGEF